MISICWFYFFWAFVEKTYRLQNAKNIKSLYFIIFEFFYLPEWTLRSFVNCMRDVRYLYEKSKKKILFEKKHMYFKPPIIWIKWLSLQKRGFRNIVIFESRDEVGGKTTSRLYRNVWVDLGTVGLTETYDKTVDLLEKFNTGFEVRPTLPGATWLNRKGKIFLSICYL